MVKDTERQRGEGFVYVELRCLEMARREGYIRKWRGDDLINMKESGVNGS